MNPCPPASEYTQMLLGRLSEAQTADLEEHLDECPRCLGVVETLNVESQLVDALKKAPSASQSVTPDLQQLMRQLEGLHPSVDVQRKSGDIDLIPQLGKPEGPDELGRLAHFRLLELLGAGGMGVVYRAEDTKLQRSVALKVLRPRMARDPVASARFLREARAIAALRHDHVVVVHEVGEAGEGPLATPYLAMELLRGESLESWQRAHRPPPIAEVLRIGQQIAEALSALHARGMIHRDVKPANLWLEMPESSEEGVVLASCRVKLLDFGLAFSLNDTQDEGTFGTPAYMSPEQRLGQALDRRCDLFSLGCVLYELCTGERPFPDPFACPDQPPPLPANDINPSVPAELANLIGRMLRPDPESRPPSAKQVTQELSAIGERISQTPSGSGRRRLATFVVLTALAIIGLLGWAFSPRPESGGLPFAAGPVDEAWFRALKQLPTQQQLDVVLDKLRELNPGYNKAKFAGWVEPEAVIRFSERTDILQDIRPLHGLLDVKNVTLKGTTIESGKLTDVDPLIGLRLYRLDISRNPRLHDLTALRGMPLHYLNLSNTAVASLNDVADAPLEELFIAHSKITDLSPLRGIPTLQLLDCTGCAIQSFEPVLGVKELSLSYRPERDTATLKRMPNLQKINGRPVAEFWKEQIAP